MLATKKPRKISRLLLIIMFLCFLWIDLSAYLWIGEESAKLILHQQPSGAIAWHRCEELDLYPNSSLAINGRRSGEVIHFLPIQRGGKDFAIRLAPDEHPAFEGNC